MALHWFLVLCCLSSFSFYSSSSTNPNCKTTCGNISIPYPFGMGQDPTCFRSEVFRITCNESTALLKEDLEVLTISLNGTLRINVPIGWHCYNESGNEAGYRYHFESGPYTISKTDNKLIAIGCDILTNVTAHSNPDVAISTYGCVSSCPDKGVTSAITGSCTGIGCCQSSIPPYLTGFKVDINRLSNGTSGKSSNPCRYAFLADQDFNLDLSDSDLLGTNFRDRNKKVPVVLDWMADWNANCEVVPERNYACLSKNSNCTDFGEELGYQCRCTDGYEGNPYLDKGCKEIDKCKNTEGSDCCCNSKGFMAYVALGAVILPFLLIQIWTIWFWMKRKAGKLKEKFFQQNGGLMLQQKICSRKGDTFKIFTIEELKRATNNFNASTIVGQGGFGIVYKGVLPNNRIVAIKKSKLVDASQIEQFINELDILSQINHKNVVKLVGCCLEDQVPILVYEFISNGTLYQHIHEAGNFPSISLENRLRIATEIAEALAYLHSSASIPIFHRDVKSANILLDNNLIAKVADFGVSRLVPVDHTHITTLVQGTWGYLDPESFQTGKLTDKSDVYSFGVVLVELLTGEKAVCLNRRQEDRNLATYFVHAMQENYLFQTLEERVRSEASEEQLMAIAQLAIRCLRYKGDERPTMKEVLVDLQVLRRFQGHHWVHDQETGKLSCETSQSCTEEAGGQFSIENQCDMSLTLNR